MKIREKIERYTWSVESVDELIAETKPLLDYGFAIPVEPGGWWHQYVCPRHHTELLFDPLEEDAIVYRCPHGCELTGEPFRGAWLAFKHQSLARYTLQSAAIYAATRDEQYATLGREILLRYAVQFPMYPVHPDAQPWMLKGRAFHQALTEAIWATTLLRGYLLLHDEGVDLSADQEVFTPFLNMLEDSMTQYRHILVHERNNPENNYTAWLNAALSCVYAIRGNKSKLEELIDGEGGLLHHLTIGVKPDQFEFEGSVYYHIFVLRAYLIVAEMAERFGLNLYALEGKQGQSFKGMLDVLVDLADANGKLPALHDGPYRRLPYTREICEIFEIGLSKYQDIAYAPILSEAYRQLKKGVPLRQGLEALVFGTDNWQLGAINEKSSSTLLPESGFAILRYPENALSLIVDFGPHGGSHGHYDKLNIVLNHQLGAIAPELGMVPYGSDMRKGWYAETASHNTIAVGGQSQQPHQGECKKYEITSAYSYIWTSSNQAYTGCLMNRHLLLTQDWLLDWFEVSLTEGDKEQQVDWWLHPTLAFDMLNSDVDNDHCSRLGEKDGYNLIEPISWVDGNSHVGQYDIKLSVDINPADPKQQHRVNMSTLLQPFSSLHKVRTPGAAMDPSQTIDGIMHRQTSNNAQFVTVYRDGSEYVELCYVTNELIRIGVGEQEWQIKLTSTGLHII